MKDKQARQLLKHALDNQQSIRTTKLRKILMAMNVSLYKDNQNEEIEYLKGEIKKLKKQIRKMRKG